MPYGGWKVLATPRPSPINGYSKDFGDKTSAFCYGDSGSSIMS